MLNRLFTALLLMTCSVSVHAGLVIQGSRIIYEEARGEAAISVEFVGATPILLQAWMDAGEDAVSPGAQEVPFILMPAVTRLEPGNGQTIRILRTRDGLPQDHESVFYFNTLEVPPSPTESIAAGETYMQFSIRGRFKFFYRPRGLPVASDKAIEMLRFAIAAPDEEGRVQVRVSNPSPYHITFSTLALHPVGAEEGAEPLVRFGTDAPYDRMVTPMGELVMPMAWGTLPAGAPLPAEVELEFVTINDSGGIETRKVRVG